MGKLYNTIVGLENVFCAFEEFCVGKRKKKDVMAFCRNLEDNLFTIHRSLMTKTYKHGTYQMFYVKDPKVRQIHKATVADRLVHHIVSSHLERIFEPTFIKHSYSCRKNKGTHKAVFALWSMAQSLTAEGNRNCWVLKCDVRKFFASVDQKILLELLERRIADQDFLWLLGEIIYSYCPSGSSPTKGIPIGNLTSQFFANIYLNELDQFVTNSLKIENYIRYADDFVILSTNRNYLINLIPAIGKFLKLKLGLQLHPNKIFLRKIKSGVDFLGYVVFLYYILPRTKTKRRLISKIKSRINDYKEVKISEIKLNQTIQSYFGYLSHANSYKLRQELANLIWFWLCQ